MSFSSFGFWGTVIEYHLQCSKCIHYHSVAPQPLPMPQIISQMGRYFLLAVRARKTLFMFYLLFLMPAYLFKTFYDGLFRTGRFAINRDTPRCFMDFCLWFIKKKALFGNISIGVTEAASDVIDNLAHFIFQSRNSKPGKIAQCISSLLIRRGVWSTISE